MTRLSSAIRSFLGRPYRLDIDELDLALAERGRGSAGLTKYAPPSVLTGNPYALERGRCIGIFGINPHCLGLEDVRADRDVLISRAQIDAGRMEDYEATRANFFELGDPQYNAEHFNRLIERIQVGLLGYDERAVRDFGAQAFMLDLLPWWSSNVAAIDPKRCTLSLEPLSAWKELLDVFVDELQPRLILVNGSSFAQWAGHLFGAKFTRFVYREWRSESGRCCRLHALHGRHRNGTPILMHGQVNYQAGPQSQANYDALIRCWEREAKIDARALLAGVLRPSR